MEDVGRRALSELHGIDPSHIPEQVWRQLTSTTTRRAMLLWRAATFRTNTRTRHWLLRRDEDSGLREERRSPYQQPRC
jgi:hypothetical protein